MFVFPLILFISLEFYLSKMCPLRIYKYIYECIWLSNTNHNRYQLNFFRIASEYYLVNTEVVETKIVVIINTELIVTWTYAYLTIQFDVKNEDFAIFLHSWGSIR